MTARWLRKQRSRRMHLADQITHSLADIIRFRLLMIAAGYEDGNDANCLARPSRRLRVHELVRSAP